MDTEWLTAWPQVGDAPEYLWQGKDCAYDGQCFNTLRPIISMLWFSLPHRLGLPATAILGLHALLLVCSIALSVRIMIRLAGRSEQFFRLQQAIFILCSSVIHAVFLWPTFFYSLTDTPAALLMLCAIFFLINLQMSSARFRGISYCLVGLMLGCAEGLRIFYLYPLLIFLVLYLGISLLAKQRDWRRLYLLSALLPVLLQNYATFLYSGEIAHMPSSSEMRYWSAIHRSSTYTGYDTLIPEQGYPWFKSPGIVTQGIGPSWQKNNWQQLSCLIAGRLYFLLGSYAPKTYFETHAIDFYDQSTPENLEFIDKTNWDNPYTVDAYILRANSTYENLWEASVKMRPEKGSITAALTTQSNETSTSLKISINTIDGHTLAEKLIPMTAQPTRNFLHATINSPGEYLFVFSTDKTLPAPTLFQMGDLRITPSDKEEEFPTTPDRIRYWSLLLLTTQLAIIAAYVIAALKKARQRPEWLAIAVLPILILAQASIAVPEQRFIIFAEICFFLTAAAILTHYLVHYLACHLKHTGTHQPNKA